MKRMNCGVTRNRLMLIGLTLIGISLQGCVKSFQSRPEGQINTVSNEYKLVVKARRLRTNKQELFQGLNGLLVVETDSASTSQFKVGDILLSYANAPLSSLADLNRVTQEMNRYH